MHIAMASFSVVEAYQPVRSISLPCRLHPTSHDIKTKLNLLKARVLFRSTSAAGASTLEAQCIQMDLTQLLDLYNCIQMKLNSPLTQQSVLQHQRKLIEEALDMSIGLVDVCGSARDLLLQMKERVQELQSALRRKGGEFSIKGDIHDYICFRRKARSDVVKTLRVLKIMKSNVVVTKSSYDVNHHMLLMVINELRELSTITISIMQSIFLFISMPVLTTSRWSVVSELMSNKSHKDEKKKINQVGNIDVTLCSLHKQIGKGNSSKADVQVIKRRLDEVDGSIEVVEDGVGRLFRCLIKHRVSLLNLIIP